MESIINSCVSNRLANDDNTIIGTLLKGEHIKCTTKDINTALEMIFEKRAELRITYINNPVITQTDIPLYVRSMKCNNLPPSKIIGSLVSNRHIQADAKSIMEVYNSITGRKSDEIMERKKAYDVMIQALENKIEELKKERDSL